MQRPGERHPTGRSMASKSCFHNGRTFGMVNFKTLMTETSDSVWSNITNNPDAKEAADEVSSDDRALYIFNERFNLDMFKGACITSWNPGRFLPLWNYQYADKQYNNAENLVWGSRFNQSQSNNKVCTHQLAKGANNSPHKSGFQIHKHIKFAQKNATNALQISWTGAERKSSGGNKCQKSL